ncbi:acetoacetate decarboxylase family protein [Conexibacter sp. CPCC 206217]|uniref:acetoacetate decarboxylase family protein n=1 Tax=Conexibacter sp. CPCC 206217 TaxID=3064574 RepID=UPI00271C4849|nr:acetoacetate decarboxylase family protein [Conexibacter sp. CPCC 206217]MDO8212563.1 acetoacetate decarboxylase family protein [Conexibacter sp. CPCC 206217]
MPVGFGPSLGPRQGPDGKRFTGEVSRSTLMSNAFVTEPAALAAVLPAGFRPAEVPLVTVRMHYNHNMPWLAGRAYHFVEVDFAVVFEGERDRVEGDFVAVMWENMADPIIVGREECGHPKLFADIPDPIAHGGSSYGSASWEGFRFLDMTWEGLELTAFPDGIERDSEATTNAGGRPRFNYQYQPSTAGLEQADIARVVMFPPGQSEQRVLQTWSGEGRCAFTPARWEDLPTFAQIVNALHALPVAEWRPAQMVHVARGFNDLRDTMQVLA